MINKITSFQFVVDTQTTGEPGTYAAIVKPEALTGFKINNHPEPGHDDELIFAISIEWEINFDATTHFKTIIASVTSYSRTDTITKDDLKNVYFNEIDGLTHLLYTTLQENHIHIEQISLQISDEDLDEGINAELQRFQSSL